MVQFRYRPPLPKRHRDRLRVPESHTLFVCPLGCGRRHALRAWENGYAADCSFYYLSQADVVSGDYEGKLGQVVANLFQRLGAQPRVLSIMFNCVDDFLGTDEEALRSQLAAAFPRTRFLIGRINPVAEGGASDRFGMQGNVYQLLEPQAARDAGLSIVGRFNSLPDSSEFQDVMRSWGVGPLHNLAECRTYDEYQQLAASSLALSVSWMGDAPAADMQERLGIPWAPWQRTYGLAGMMRNYQNLHAALAAAGRRPALPAERLLDDPAAQDAYQRAAHAWSHARQAVGQRPVAVDSLATFAPFTLAKDLAQAGFRVTAVLGLHVKGDQKEAAARLAQDHPNIEQIFTADQAESSPARQAGNLIAIGRDAATLLGATAAVDLFHDEGCFGFQGIALLMEALAKAAESDSMEKLGYDVRRNGAPAGPAPLAQGSLQSQAKGR